MERSNRQIRRVYGALDKLSGRTLPSIASDLKTAALIRNYFGPPFQVTEDLRVKIIKDNPAPEEGPAPDWVSEKRMAEFEAMQDQVQEMPDIPDRLLLTEADMPKALKSNEANRQGVADIIACLEDLYELEEETE